MDLRRCHARASCIEPGLLHVVALSIRSFWLHVGRTLMPTGEVARSIGVVIDQGKQEDPMSLAALMVHVDVEHDSEQRVELAIGLADRFQTALIGVAGCALWLAFMAGDVGLTKSSQYDFQKVMVRFEQRGKKFHAQGRSLRQIEWRSALETPRELLLREDERRISSSSVASAARMTPTPGLSCCGRAGPFCWCPTPSLRCRFAVWSWHGRTRARAAARCGTRSRSCRRPRRFCSWKWARTNRSRRPRRISPMSGHILSATA